MRVSTLPARLLHHAATLRKDRFFRRLAMLSGGVALGQLFLALSTPLLTRLYAPEDFGVFAVIVAILAMFNGVSCLRLETSIPVCRSETLSAALASNLLVLLATTLLLTSGVIVTQFFLLPPKVGTAIRESLWAVPAIAFLAALTQPLVHLHVRRGEFRLYGAVRMGRLVAQGSGQILFGLTGPASIGLILGYAVGPFFALAVLLHHGIREVRALTAVRRQDILGYLREHWRHPVYLMPSSVIYQAVQFLPAVLIAALYSPAAAGFFTISQRVLGLPIRFLSNSASQVLLGEAGTASRRELSHRVKTIARQFTILGVLIILPMILLGRYGWEILFGERWGDAWFFIVALSPMYLSRFIMDTISSMLIITNNQHIRFLFSVLLLIITIFSYTLAPYLGLGPLGATAVYSAGCAIVYVAQIFIIRHLSIDYADRSSPSSPACP